MSKNEQNSSKGFFSSGKLALVDLLTNGELLNFIIIPDHDAETIFKFLFTDHKLKGEIRDVVADRMAVDYVETSIRPGKSMEAEMMVSEISMSCSVKGLLWTKIKGRWIYWGSQTVKVSVRLKDVYSKIEMSKSAEGWGVDIVEATIGNLEMNLEGGFIANCLDGLRSFFSMDSRFRKEAEKAIKNAIRKQVENNLYRFD